LRATLCALIFALAAWPLAAHADDTAAIRHDLPILVEATSPVTFDRIDIENGHAMAQWHVGRDHFLNLLEKRYGRWWLSGWGVSFTELQDGGRRYTPMPDTSPPFNGDMPFAQGIPNWMTDGGYRVELHFAPSVPRDDVKLTGFATRIPTEGESLVAPGGNSYFFHSGTVQSPQPVHVQAGTTLEVWFPFVLDPSLTYSLTIGGAGFTPIGPIDGALVDNTLHFVLPAFTAPPGVDMMGEIESD
jgi:hypothetical protein